MRSRSIHASYHRAVDRSCDRNRLRGEPLIRGGNLKRAERFLRSMPLHPQWLLGRRNAPPEILACRGLVVDVGSADRWLQRRLDPEVHYLAIDLPAVDGKAYADSPDVFGSAEALPLADESCDAVACFEVLEHVENPSRAIHEAVRVLRRGGIYVISAPFLYPLHDRPRDFRRYTPFGLRRSLTAAGLEVIAIRPMLRSLEITGMLASLAIAGGAMESSWRLLLLPMAAPLILTINLGAWVGSRLWPNWDGMAMGYEAIGRKP